MGGLNGNCVTCRTPHVEKGNYFGRNDPAYQSAPQIRFLFKSKFILQVISLVKVQIVYLWNGNLGVFFTKTNLPQTQLGGF